MPGTKCRDRAKSDTDTLSVLSMRVFRPVDLFQFLIVSDFIQSSSVSSTSFLDFDFRRKGLCCRASAPSRLGNVQTCPMAKPRPTVPQNGWDNSTTLPRKSRCAAHSLLSIRRNPMPGIWTTQPTNQREICRKSVKRLRRKLGDRKQRGSGNMCLAPPSRSLSPRRYGLSRSGEARLRNAEGRHHQKLHGALHPDR